MSGRNKDYKLKTTVRGLHKTVCKAQGGKNKINIMYSFLIDPKKWVKISETELEERTPYWFKKSNGQIVMGTPFSNGHSSGIADVYSEDGCLRIKQDTFHIVKDGYVQPVIDG